MLNMAVARPMPRPRAMTAASVWPGWRKSSRKPKRTSCRNEVMKDPPACHYAGGVRKVTGCPLLRRRGLLRLLQAAPGLLVVVEDRQRGHAAAGGVDVPAPEERPFQVGAVGLQHAEDQAVHAV